jgi:hypothetical protein
MYVTPEALAAVLESTAKNSAQPILEVVALYSDASQTHSMAALATDRYQVGKVRWGLRIAYSASKP